MLAADRAALWTYPASSSCLFFSPLLASFPLPLPTLCPAPRHVPPSPRLAPLSEGRLESDGTLQCAYHGWTFNGEGACTRIPQLKGDEKAQKVGWA